MARNWTFGQQLSAGYALAGLTLLIVALVGYRSTSNLIANDAMVSHTYLVRQDFSDMLSTLKDAETGQRGFVITGDETYLAPYTAATSRIKDVFDDLRKLTSDNPNQQRRLDAIAPLIDAKLAVTKQTVGLRRTAGFDAAVKMVQRGQGNGVMDQIRVLAAAGDKEEADLLARRETEAQSSAQWAMGIILWGCLAGVAIVAAIGWFITSSLSRKIGGAVGLVQSSSSELQSAANQQATGAKEQSSAMNEIATTIRELIATSRQIAESAQRVAHIAAETDRSARLGDDTVEKANASVSSIRRQVDLIVSHMLDLGKKSQQIGSVLEIVSELAEQTNILAINATIEAAGAGEFGKRFAVVADEIRKLADRVAGSAKEIRGLIDDVRAATNTTVMATESGSKAVDLGSRQFEEVASSFKQISGLVSTTTEAAKEIELSTKQQSTAVEQVNDAISNVAQATKETEASSGQILQTASELANLSRALTRLIRNEAGA